MHDDLCLPVVTLMPTVLSQIEDYAYLGCPNIQLQTGNSPDITKPIDCHWSASRPSGRQSAEPQSRRAAELSFSLNPVLSLR
ncbi:hypothetical protein M433DRAFT_142962 [Acidomyces richmondensis BFW]|nr:MAG: hypothetical protein FE78DRAFT_78725 [Acidomyces sp. 'richmondensis']KYG46449.1 hypothetical protein M433DRAFT_142962 [Acidomyces richmondensis BFW]